MFANVNPAKITVNSTPSSILYPASDASSSSSGSSSGSSGSSGSSSSSKSSDSSTLKITAKKSGSKITVSWNKLKGATKYYLWRSKDGKDYEKVGEYDSNVTNAVAKYSSKHTYQFALTAYLPEKNDYVPYVYTDVI